MGLVDQYPFERELLRIDYEKVFETEMNVLLGLLKGTFRVIN